VASACAIMGFDPLYVANEGRFIAFVPEGQAAKALKILQKSSLGPRSVSYWSGFRDPKPLVTLKSFIGANRILDIDQREQLQEFVEGFNSFLMAFL